MSLLTRLGLLVAIVTATQESLKSKKSKTRKLDVTCVLTDIAFAMGDEDEERIGEESLDENLKYIMHGSAVDTDGKMYFVGTTNSLDLKETDDDSIDAVAMRIDEDGILNWFAVMTSSVENDDYSSGITVEDTTSAYVIGSTRDDDDIFNIFLTKLSVSDGTHSWTKEYGRDGTFNKDVRGFGVFYYDEAVYGVGLINFLKTTTNTDDALIFKVTTEGVLTWSLRISGDKYDMFSNIFVDNSGIYAFGSTTSSMSIGSYDLLQIKSSLDGAVGYKKTMGGTNTDVGTDIAFFESYEYICGYSSSVTSEDGEIGLSRSSSNDIFVLKLKRSSLTRVWGNFLGNDE